MLCSCYVINYIDSFKVTLKSCKLNNAVIINIAEIAK
nr:MAG TPA: hypothetical protein [Bacteriophage sp.]